MIRHRYLGLVQFNHWSCNYPDNMPSMVQGIDDTVVGADVNNS